MELKGQTNKTSLSYALFVHREELARRNTRFLRLSKTKLTLTDTLISSRVCNIQECSVEELRAVSRELKFKTLLKQQLQCMRRLQKMGIRNVNPNALTTTL